MVVEIKATVVVAVTPVVLVTTRMCMKLWHYTYNWICEYSIVITTYVYVNLGR